MPRDPGFGGQGIIPSQVEKIRWSGCDGGGVGGVHVRFCGPSRAMQNLATTRTAHRERGPEPTQLVRLDGFDQMFYRMSDSSFCRGIVMIFRVTAALSLFIGPAAMADVLPPTSPVPGTLWNLDLIGSRGANAAGFTGKGVVVAVMDTPPQLDHPEYATRLVDSYNIFTGAPTQSPPDDVVGHGTHVSGTIGGQTVGVAPGVTLIAIDFWQENWKETSGGEPGEPPAPGNDVTAFDLPDAESYANGVRWAIASGARVINNSWGIDLEATDPLAEGWAERNEVWVQALKEASQAGVLSVWANGNTGVANPSVDAALPYFVPELQKNWITVASVGPDGNIANYSQRCGVAAQWCISAPGGGDVLEDFLWSSFPGSVYIPLQGTSMAAPAVTGAVAIGMEIFPEASSAEIAQLVLRTAVDRGEPGVDPVYGWGLLSVQNLFSTIDPVTTSLVGNAAWSRFSTLGNVSAALRQQINQTETFDQALSDRYVWAIPFAGRSEIDSGPTSRGATSQSGGVLVGVDVLSTESWRVGIGLGYSQTALREKGVADDADGNALHGLVYASFRSGAWFSDLAGQVASFDQDLTRYSISGTAGASVATVGRSDVSSNGYEASIRVGRDVFANQKTRISAYVGSRYFSQSTDAFQEQDAGVFALSSGDSNLDQWENGIGVQWQQTIERKSGAPVEAITNVSLVNLSGDLDNGSTVKLLNRAIPVATAELDNTAALISGSLNFPMRSGRAFVAYDASLSDPEQSLALSLGFDIRF